MTDFVNWTTLGTYSGAFTAVMVLTQLTKSIPFIKKIPTQAWSYILAFVVLLTAMLFSNNVTISNLCLTTLNSGLISIAANGGFSAIKKMAGSYAEDA